MRGDTTYLKVAQATLKKSFFPVQWVAIIVANREAANNFNVYFFICIEMVGKILGGGRGEGKRSGKMCLPGTNKLTRPVDRKPTYF